MSSSDTLSQALTLLTSAGIGAASIGQGVATRLLGDLIARRLERDGYAQAWGDFKRNPANDSLVRHLLHQALQADPAFRNSFEDALRAAMNESHQNAGKQSIKITGSGDAQIGNRGDTFNGGRAATRGGTYHEGDVHNRTTNKKSNAAGFIVLAVIALVVIGLLVKGATYLISRGQNGGLSASSTCQQFLNTDETTESQALVNIAISKGFGGYGSPLALPEIRYECSGEPTITLGALIQHDGNEFG